MGLSAVYEVLNAEWPDKITGWTKDNRRIRERGARIVRVKKRVVCEVEQ